MASNTYIKKADKYKDLRSSALSLIIIGIGGDIYLILNALSLAPVQFMHTGVSGILFYIVMGSLFNIFLIGGILSFKSARNIQKGIEKEETLTKSIIDYIINTFPKSFFDETFANSEENNLYFERTDFIKAEIFKKFGELDEAYLEDLIEQIYQLIFEA